MLITENYIKICSEKDLSITLHPSILLPQITSDLPNICNHILTEVAQLVYITALQLEEVATYSSVCLGMYITVIKIVIQSF